jgi:flagellar protein FlaF
MVDQMPKRYAEAYGRAQKAALLPRQVEAMALAKAAALLGEAGKPILDFDAYRAALRFNRLVWTLVQADLARPDNGLSDEVKARMLSLSLYVDRQTVAALAAPAAAQLAPLIEINRCIAEGLLGPAERRAAAEGGEGRATAHAPDAPATKVLSA